MMSTPTSTSTGMPDAFVGHVDNRCCFCLDLRIGSVLTGLINALVNIAGFIAYVTSPAVQSSWGHPGAPVTNLDISFLVVFTLQLVCDAILVWGAFKKIPNHIVPWLWANAVIIAVFLVVITLMLFFGHLRTSLDANEFTTALSSIGVLGAAHIFSWLVVFQYRKNLIEEQRIMARMVATAPSAPDDEILPQRFERAPSPPPTYEEVAKQQARSGMTSHSEVKVSLTGSESPPEYARAMAMSLDTTCTDIDVERGAAHSQAKNQVSEETTSLEPSRDGQDDNQQQN